MALRTNEDKIVLLFLANGVEGSNTAVVRISLVLRGGT
jgi:hypothetical protein